MSDALGRKKRGTYLNIRLTFQQKQIISQAAQLKQTTVSSFVLRHAFKAAQDIIVEQTCFTLSANEWKAFCGALDAAPRNYPKLRSLLTEPSVFD